MKSPKTIGDLFSVTFAGEWGAQPDGIADIIVLRSTNFGDEGRLDLSDVVLRKIEPSIFDDKKLQRGDILLEKSGGGPDQPVGRVVLFNESVQATCSNFIQACRPRVDHDYRYIFYLLDYFYRTGVTLKFQQQTTGLMNLKLADFLKVEISPPEVESQKVIADIITTISSEIEQTEVLLAKQQRIKAGLMHDLLSRGLDANGQLRAKSELPHRKQKTLGQVARFDSGYAFKSQQLTEFGHKVVRISNLHKADFPYWHYSGPVRSEWRVTQGDLLFSWAGVASSIDAYLYEGEDALLNQHIYNLKIPCRTQRLFVFHYLTWILPKLRREIEGGVGQLYLTKSKIQAIPIPWPEPEEMAEINTLIASAEKRARILSHTLEKLRRQKTGLMKDLLTGRVRVTPLLPPKTHKS